MFWLRKSKCSESFETISVVRAENCGEKFDNCGCANKWEWVSVNSSQTGQVSRRHEKPVGHLKLHLLVCAVLKNILKNNKLLRNPKQWHTQWRSLYERRRPVELELKVCEEIKKPGTHRCAVLWYCSSWFYTSQDLTFGLDATRGECALEVMVLAVAISRLKSWSVGAFTWLSLRWF